MKTLEATRVIMLLNAYKHTMKKHFQLKLHVDSNADGIPFPVPYEVGPRNGC